MKRRDFLLKSAALGLLSEFNPRFAMASTKKIHHEVEKVIGAPARIDGNRLEGRNTNRSSVVGRRGAVATSQSVASTVGAEILKSGGNAIDAAVAMNAIMSLVEPGGCGPGGDLFAIVWIEKERKLYGLNASGRSPFAWNREEAKKRGFTEQLPELGPYTWSVPGCVSGWNALLGRFGRRSLEQTLVPAHEYAQEGYVVSEIIGDSFSQTHRDFRDFPNAAGTYLVNGRAPEYGQVFRNPDLARFFEILMRQGAAAFYQGEIAHRIVQYSKERQGLFSLKDFENHEVSWVDPVSSSYRGYDIWEIPPNGQGIAALQILNMMEQFDIPKLKPNSGEHLHLFIEAKKLAFEDRAVYYADMDGADVPVEQLISKDYARRRARLISPGRAAKEVRAGELDGSRDTIYLCTADQEGNMVSLIQSNYWSFGSREVPTGLGFCLQNRGRSFSLHAEHRNRLEPHKRPFHTIIPGFVTQDGNPRCAFGVMGGDMQPQGHAQVLMNMIDFQLSPQQAGEQPRLQHFGSSHPWGGRMEEGGAVGVEAGIEAEAVEQLKEKGHQITEVGSGRYGGYQAIWREDEPLRYLCGSDPRKDGAAVGY